MKRHRIRLTEYFQDHDLLRKGFIEPSKFRSVLNAQHVQLTSHEYSLLEHKYACADRTHLVNYANFVNDIDAIFTAKDLERNPTKTVNKFYTPNIYDFCCVLTDEEMVRLDALMERLGTHVRHHRLLLKPFFQDKDKSRSGFISMASFRSIFDYMKLRASEEEFLLLNKSF